jgi:hypothetical protein
MNIMENTAEGNNNNNNSNNKNNNYKKEDILERIDKMKNEF